jgi:hypothetical protein
VNKTRTMFILMALLDVTDWANAVCPEKPVSICEIVRQNPVYGIVDVAELSDTVDLRFRGKIVRSVALNASLYMDPKCLRYQNRLKNS